MFSLCLCASASKGLPKRPTPPPSYNRIVMDVYEELVRLRQLGQKCALATIVEVAESQSLLVQAEIDDRLARLNVWRRLEGVAAAQGNLQPFLELVRAQSTVRLRSPSLSGVEGKGGD